MISARAAKAAQWGLSIAATAPAVLYVAESLWSVAVMASKTGWESRPFLYIGGNSILVFVLYVQAVGLGLGWVWKRTTDRVVGLCAALLGLMLLLYWMGFLTWSVGILPPTVAPG